MLRVSSSKRMIIMTFFLSALLVSCERVRSFSPGDSQHVIAFPSVSKPDVQFEDPYPAPDDGLSQFYGTPPQAVLQVGGHEQTAAMASTCWVHTGSEGQPEEKCQEARDILTPQVFLPGEIQFTGQLRFNIPLKPTAVGVFLMPVIPTDVLEPPSEGIIRWQVKEGNYISLANEIEQDLQLELESGLNVLHVYAQWEGLGSVGYGFLIEAKKP
jgi:hypothetical protein